MEDCWKSDPTQRPSFTEVAVRLDVLVQRWRLDSESTSQILSKINPETTHLSLDGSAEMFTGTTPPLHNTPSTSQGPAAAVSDRSLMMSKSEHARSGLSIEEDCLNLSDPLSP